MLRAPLQRRLHAPLGERGGAAGGVAIPDPLPADAAVELDAEALRRLRELDPTGANRLLERVFQAFETSARRLMPQMHAAHLAGDPAGVRHVVHTLKSSSASIGAIKLSQVCAEIETMIRHDALDGLPKRLAEMDRETASVLRALKRVPGVAS